ncbi:MAG: sporulation transcriptional regulator SpoIIID [Oscillospiraceae bacterium]|nr:sporulation transcriptional regulator SpoIIID [Oscillospiraceae bacterium]
MSNRLSGDCSIPKFFVPCLTPADLSCRLQQYNYALYVQVRRVLDKNKQERHIRGGMATKRKYKGN